MRQRVCTPQWFAKALFDQPRRIGQFEIQMFGQAAIELVKSVQHIGAKAGGDIGTRQGCDIAKLFQAKPQQGRDNVIR